MRAAPVRFLALGLTCLAALPLSAPCLTAAHAQAPSQPPSQAPSQPPSQAPSQAEALEQLTAAEASTQDAWNRLKLTQRRITFVSEKAQGYGMYQDRQSNIFRPGEKIVTYVEPIGYRWKALPGEMYEMNFIVDLLLKDDKGEVLAEKKAFSKTVTQSHNAGREFFMNLTLSLDGVPAGSYVVTYTLHDMSGSETSSFDQEFNIAGE